MWWFQCPSNGLVNRQRCSTFVILILILTNVTKVFALDDDRIYVPRPLAIASSQYSDSADGVKSPRYEEYFIEHNVTQKDAKKAFSEIGVHLIDKPSPAWCTRRPCNETIMAYCLNGQMLHDHCCCEARHAREFFPWIPHSCYVGQEQLCRAKIGSCIHYEEYRDCCCTRALARRWKTIYSGCSSITIDRLAHALAVTLVSLVWTWAQ